MYLLGFDKKRVGIFFEKSYKILRHKMNRKLVRNIINIICFCGLIWFALYLHENRVYKFNKTALIMDTFVEVRIETKSPVGETIISDVFDLMRDYEQKLDYYNPDSSISKVNGQKESEMFSELYEMLQIAAKLYDQTDKRYDLTIGELAELWKVEKVPSEQALQQALKTTGFDLLEYDETKIIKPEAVKLNLGSIAKGFIIDRAIEYVRKYQVKSAIINAGGDLRIIGYDETVSIGVQHPRAVDGELLARLEVGNVSLVTSGDYERFFEEDGVRYHHLLDAVTGFPARENVSVSVIAATATMADAYATAFFVMPADKALKLAEETAGIELFLVKMEKDKLITMSSSGMKKYIKEVF